MGCPERNKTIGLQNREYLMLKADNTCGDHNMCGDQDVTTHTPTWSGISKESA